jgi:hypothetical protein
VIGDHIHRSSAAFQVLMPVFEGLKNCEKFLVVSVVVEFRGIKGAGMESDGVNFTIGGVNGEDGSEGIVRGIHLDHNLGVGHPMGEQWCMCEFLLEFVEGCVAFAIKVPRGILSC